MIENVLLVASFLVFLAVAFYARVRSNLGLFIVFTGLLIGLLNLAYVIMQLV
jgi:hypothetical protein